MAVRSSPDPWAAYVRALGVRLQQLRVDQGLTQERLAVAANITSFTYRKLEKGESNPGTPANPRLKTLISLAAVLDVDVRDLLPMQRPSVEVDRFTDSK